MSVYDRLKAANPSMSEEQLRTMAANMENVGKGAETIVEEEEKKEEITTEDVAPEYKKLQDQLKENKELLNSIESGSANLYEDDKGNVFSSNDFKKFAEENNMSVEDVLKLNPQFKQARTRVIDSNNDGIIDENDEQLSEGIAEKMERLKGPEFISENTINDVSIAWNNTRLLKKAGHVALGRLGSVAGYEAQLKVEDYKTKREQAIENKTWQENR